MAVTTTDRSILKESMKKIFGFDKFLNNEQKYAMLTIFEGKNDVYLNLGPGYGKSLCFQLPALLKDYKLAVVFVPTHTLAMDQMMFLRKNNISAEYLCSRTPKERIQAMMNYFRNRRPNDKRYQFLYVLVEKSSVDISGILFELNNRNVLSYIVFDEVHCMSFLSHDYVPAYQDMAKLVKDTCPNVCKIALTATTTREARRVFIRKLDMANAENFRSLDHKVTYYDVHFIDTMANPIEHLIEFINKALNVPDKEHHVVPLKCGIIFCRKQQMVNILTRKLRSMNISAISYHGGMPLSDREKNHASWVNGTVPVIIATHTFGIGLHKENVRFVVHWNLPLSFLQLYQECGRISRGEKRTYYRIYYSYDEEENIRTYIKSLSIKPNENGDVVTRRLKWFDEVISYCLRAQCRHVAHFSYFGLTVRACRMYCDVCKNIGDFKSRVTEFLKYRELMKKATADRLVNKNVWDMFEITKLNPRTKSNRDRSYDRLLDELMTNYNKMREEIEEPLRKSDLVKIAHRLENSFYINAYTGLKYSRNIIQTVMGIRKATASGLVSNYLKCVKTEEEPVVNSPPVIVVDLMEMYSNDEDVVPEEIEQSTDNSVVVVDPVVTAAKSPEIIDLVSESSGSETP